jgi:hypothetical protein
MLLRFQKAAVRGNYETGNQAFSKRLRFLTIRAIRDETYILYLQLYGGNHRSICCNSKFVSRIYRCEMNLYHFFFGSSSSLPFPSASSLSRTSANSLFSIFPIPHIRDRI